MSISPRTSPRSPPLTPRTEEEEEWDEHKCLLRRLFRFYPQHTCELRENITLQEMKDLYSSKVELVKQEQARDRQQTKRQALQHAVNLMREFEAKTHISDQN